jgi:hypothetical protein
MTGRIRWPACAALLLGFSTLAHSGDGSPLNERASVGLGTFFLSSDTHVRADAFSSGRVGTPLDFEDTFGLSDDRVFRVDASWRVGNRHLLRAMYFKSDRSVTRTIDENIDFGDATFPVNADVAADFRFHITELAYEYVFMQTDGYQLGASFGIHNAAFRIGLSADLVSTEGDGVHVEETVRTNAPLPVFGLRGRWHITGDVYVLAHAQYFQLAFDSYKGDVQDYEAALVWQVAQRFGVGAAYNVFRTRFGTDDRDHFEGRLRWQYAGPQLFMRMSF